MKTASILFVLATSVMAVATPVLADEAPQELPALESSIPVSDEVQGARDDAWRLKMTIENDSYWLKPNHYSDRWYTNGLLVSLSHQPQWAQDLLPCLPFADDFAEADPAGTHAAAGYFAGQLMFTPRDIEIKTPQHGDRPFAGYLFAGAFFQRANDQTLDHMQVEVGMTGPSSLAGETQNFIHRNAAGRNPRGWNTQLHDEPTLQAYLRKKWRVGLFDIPMGEQDTRALKFDIIPEAGIAAGTVYRHLELGATVRAGFIMPDDFGPGTIANMASATGSPTPQGWSGYGFAGIAGKVVEHNMFLDGSDFHTNQVEVAHEPLVGEGSVGLVVNYRHENTNVSLLYSQTYSTREFRSQDGTHSYATLRLTVAFLF